MNDLIFIGNLQTVFAFLTLITAFYFYSTEKLSIEITSIWILGSLSLFFYAFPILDAGGINTMGISNIFAGFTNPAVITVISLMIIGETLNETGALESLGNYLIKKRNNKPFFILTIGLIFIGIMSAFLNNVPMVVVFMPVIIALTARLKMSGSKWLLPLSYITILGGMTTLVGSSTNLIVSGAIEQSGETPFTFFSFTEIGVMLALIGGVYTIFILPRIIPAKRTLRSEVEIDERKFFSNIKVSESSPLSGLLINGWKIKGYDADVIVIKRGNEIYERPFNDRVILPNDEVLVLSDRETLMSFASKNIENFTDIEDEQQAQEQVLAEIIVSMKSPFIGRTLRNINLAKNRDLTPIGLERNSGILQTEIMDTKLKAGDVLLVVGELENIAKVAEDCEFIMIESSASDIRHRHHVFHTLAIFTATIALIASGVLSTAISALVGAIAMITFGCISFSGAMKAIDKRVIMLIASTLAIGLAMQQTEASELISNTMLYVLDGLSPSVILSLFFLTIVFMTNILSNQATAVIFTPIAISLAQTIGVDINAFTFAVVFAANCCFITPFAYQTNLLVMNPGNYTFKDFVKFGTPLAIIVWLSYSVIAPYYFNF
ncbi:MAG: SLC13 family permease [Alphaproteobacteria bacterium]